MDFLEEEKRIDDLLASGWSQLAAGDYRAAWRSFETVLLLDSEHPLANTVGAFCLIYLNEFAAAEPLLKKAIAITPEASLLYFLSGEILEATGKPDEALADIWEAVALEPFNSDYRVALARHLFHNNQSQEGLRQLEKVLEDSPENAQAHLWFGVYLNDNRRYDEAERELELALSLAPMDEMVLIINGIFHFLRGHNFGITPLKLEEFRKSADLFHKVVELNPQNETAKTWLKDITEWIERTSKPIDAPPLKTPRFERPIDKLAIVLLLIGFIVGYTYAFGNLLEWNEPFAWFLLFLFYSIAAIAMLIGGWIRGDFTFLPWRLCNFFNRVFSKRIAKVEKGKLRLTFDSSPLKGYSVGPKGG